MIEGVMVKRLRVIPDERGRLMELLRADDEIFVEFGQVYLTTAYPGVVKAWHYHRRQFDNFVVVKGMMKVALYDDRAESASCGEVKEFIMGEHNPVLVRIPPLVYHGFKCISETEAILINIPTRTYDYVQPDEYRIHPYQNNIPYDWERKDS